MKHRTPWNDRKGKSREQQGYGSAHMAMRAHLMATVVLCEHCTAKGRSTVGTHADHIIPKSRGGSDDRSNYQLLCEPCHRTKSLAERGFKVRPTIGLDGWPIED